MIILPICMNISYHWQFLLQRVAVAQSSHGALQNDKSTSLFQVLFSLLLTLLPLSVQDENESAEKFSIVEGRGSFHKGT